MAIFSRLVFWAVKRAARRGLREEAPAASGGALQRKEQARRTGVRGETYAYWYLRGMGYVFVARNYQPAGMKGEIDLVGYDGETLVFVEVRTRTVRAGQQGVAEQSVTRDKQEHVIRTARRFLAARRVKAVAVRFDVVAIESRAGREPVVRLHKDAFLFRM
jgi:putative endonuclease